MALPDLISEDCIKVPLTGTTKTEIIRELLQILKDAGKIRDLEKALGDVRKREDQGSTGLEQGIAVPHAKTDTVSTLTLAVGIAPDGVDFEALDEQPSRIFFLMLAPPDQSGPHIEALAEVARMSQSAAFMRALIGSRTPQEVMEMFQE
jgi:fructose-specific phosphotransferase system IIA component